MSTVKVVDLNNQAVEEAPEPQQIEEVPQEQELEIINQVVEEVNEQPKEEKPKEEAPKQLSQGESSLGQSPKPKRQTQKDKIQCPKCFKEMTVKSFRYSHEKNCGGQLSEKPVKPHSKAKPKQQAKPKASSKTSP